MPPTFNSKDELSLRHLPNISNASFSFQIPPSLSKGDTLLGDDGSDFFQGAGDNITGSSSIPLTLAELTPTVNAAQTHSTVFLAHLSNDLPDLKSEQIPQSILKVSEGLPPLSELSSRPVRMVTRSRAGEASPAVARLRALKAEVEMLNEDSRSETADVTPQPTLAEGNSSKLPRVITKRKRTPISGRITKSRSKKTSSKSNFARCLTSAPPAQTREPTHELPNGVACEEQNPDSSLYPTTTSGAAERLVSYSQKIVGSFGLSRDINSELACKPIAVPDPILIDPSASRNNAFTLSQLSPHKPVSSRPSSPAITTPVSPMRPPSKRPATIASSHQVSKKGKTIVAAASNDTKGPSMLEDAVRGVPPDIDSSSGIPPRFGSSSRRVHVPVTTRTGAPTRKLAKATTRAVSRSIPSKAFVPCAPDLNGAAGPCSNSSQQSQADDDLPAKLSVTRQSEETCSSVAAGSSAAASQRDCARVVLPPAKPTKPVEFTFHVDTRLEARKAEYVKERLPSTQKQRKQHPPIPDFKAQHAQQEAVIAHRKENIHPTIPLPLELHTHERAKEREKFDRILKEKERELEREIEKRRKEEEENEAREVRELRKKAIPRAHDVPEWYKEAPKRKSKSEVESSIGD